jgi:hypothetical protein
MKASPFSRSANSLSDKNGDAQHTRTSKRMQIETKSHRHSDELCSCAQKSRELSAWMFIQPLKGFIHFVWEWKQD